MVDAVRGARSSSGVRRVDVLEVVGRADSRDVEGVFVRVWIWAVGYK